MGGTELADRPRKQEADSPRSDASCAEGPMTHSRRKRFQGCHRRKLWRTSDGVINKGEQASRYGRLFGKK